MLRKLIPERTRQWLREKQREVQFRQAMRACMARPLESAENSGLMGRLVAGWGNPGFVAQPEYLAACVRAAARPGGSILECGSGLSTVMLAVAARENGREVWTLEHIPAWAERVQRTLDRYGFDNVHLHCGPLQDHGGFDWYTAPTDLPCAFDLVVCDGPPGETRGGRYGLMPLLHERLSPGCLVLADDAIRQAERGMVQLWQQEFGTTFRVLGETKPYLQIRVPPDGRTGVGVQA